MRLRDTLRSARFALGAGLLVAAVPLPAATPAEPPSGFDVQQIADGVYVAIRREPPGLFFESNNVFIVNDEDVVVVDANITPASTRETIAALRRITSKPVRYVVNTHWHDDHLVGNSAWREAYPGVEFIAHASAPSDLASVGAANRKGLLEHGPAFADQLAARVEKGEGIAGGAMGEDERVMTQSDVAQARRYFAASSTFDIVTPTLTIEDRLTLHRGQRTIEVRWLGRGHTAADLVVHLPREGIVVAGDLVDAPVPLVGSTSFPLDYPATLRRLLELPHTVIVPGHGPVLRDDTHVERMIALLEFITREARAAKARGETVEQALERIDFTGQRKLFTDDVVPLRIMFAMYVRNSGMAAAFAQIEREAGGEGPAEQP